MTQTLTTERFTNEQLREIADGAMLTQLQDKIMARELLANREAQPVGFYTSICERGGVIWHNGAPEDDTAIYTVPPVPSNTQPVGYTSAAALDLLSHGEAAFIYKDAEVTTFVEEEYRDVIPLYTAPPAASVLAQPVSQGCKLVPLEPTRQMMAQGHFAMKGTDRGKFRRIYQAMVAATPSAPNSWIACSEQMPEPNKHVQVSNGVWVGIGMYNDAEHFEDDERWQDEHNEFIDLLHHPVTHWMPLPTAPGASNEK